MITTPSKLCSLFSDAKVWKQFVMTEKKSWNSIRRTSFAGRTAQLLRYGHSVLNIFSDDSKATTEELNVF